MVCDFCLYHGDVMPAIGDVFVLSVFYFLFSPSTLYTVLIRTVLHVYSSTVKSASTTKKREKELLYILLYKQCSNNSSHVFHQYFKNQFFLLPIQCHPFSGERN